MTSKKRSQRTMPVKYLLPVALFSLIFILLSTTLTDGTAANNPKKFFRTFRLSNFRTKKTKLSLTQNANQDEPVYEWVKTEPAFPGGIDKFYDFVSRNVHYPAEDKKNNVSDHVYVRFVVEKNGSLTDVTASGKRSDAMNAEAERVVKMSPKWIPGRHNGKNVRVAYTVPIDFGRRSGTPSGHAYLVTGTDIYGSADVEPDFPGSVRAFEAFLGATIKYPEKERQMKITGKVFVQFVVEKDGSLSNIKTLRSPNESFREEAERVIKLSPAWIAGKMGDKPARVLYTVVVNFTLPNIIETPEGGVYDGVDVRPTPLINHSFNRLLTKEIKYTEDARKNHIEGTVDVTFIVEKDGSITNIKLAKGLGHGLDEEAVRAVQVVIKPTQWLPGIQKGEVVRVLYTLPVNFTLTAKHDEEIIINEPVGK